TWGDGKIFRPYRDIRFSRDKSPYKTAIGAVVGHGYVQLDARELAAGSGMWEMAPDQLARYRDAIDRASSGEALAELVANIRATKADVTGHGELKTAPRGYPKDHPRIELLRYKGLVAWREWPAGAWLGTKRAKDRIAKFFELAEPLARWLDAHVGASTMPERAR
ncbi:MAG TPA: DUF2461 domain-containing protein, partial [Actinomycetota bacterium]|nr:DUF2461 domain-containing protein [Actinomycetota bacterium]